MKNVNKLNNDFYYYQQLKNLSDLSKWDIQNSTEIYSLFGECSSLIKLPDISKWNTNNIINFGGLFYNCSSLKYLLLII